MATRLPTILATSGGFAESARLRWEVGPLTRFAVELAGVIGRAPRVCFLGTASGDDPVPATSRRTESRMSSGSAPTGEMSTWIGHCPKPATTSGRCPPVKASPPPVNQLADLPHENQSGEWGRRPRPGPAVVARHPQRGTSTTVRRRIRSGARAVVGRPPGLAPGIRRSTPPTGDRRHGLDRACPAHPETWSNQSAIRRHPERLRRAEMARIGIGTALVEAASEHATHLGSLCVTVHSGRKAVPLYERMGFESSRRLLLRPPD